MGQLPSKMLRLIYFKRCLYIKGPKNYKIQRQLRQYADSEKKSKQSRKRRYIRQTITAGSRVKVAGEVMANRPGCEFAKNRKIEN